jgi:hypothetical protein
MRVLIAVGKMVAMLFLIALCLNLELFPVRLAY